MKIKLNSLTQFLIPGILAGGCTTTGGDAPARDGTVEVHGALRAMMHEGKTGTTVTLDTMLPDTGLYALGALTDLAGEVTIIAGAVYLAYPEGEDRVRIRTMGQSDAGATLLVSAVVPEWRAVTVEEPIPFDGIDDEIGRLAAGAGIDTEGRVPFLVEGDFRDLQWHVVDGSRIGPGMESRADHQNAAVKDTIDRAKGTLVGFYSPKDQGVFTHMGSKTHLHCAVGDPVRSGHVDHVLIPAGSVVKFPGSLTRP